MRIRAAESKDLPRLLELYHGLEGPYPQTPAPGGEAPRRRFEAVLADEHQQTLVAEASGEVVGTLVVAILPNLAHDGAPYAVVENVVVDESRREEGIGGALLTEALGRARAAGAYKLSLSTNVAREAAHAFYRRLGLEETHAGFEVRP